MVAITDQGYRERKHYRETEIVNARDLRRQTTTYGKRKVKKQLKNRSAIEPVIEHLKSGHRLSRTYFPHFTNVISRQGFGRFP